VSQLAILLALVREYGTVHEMASFLRVRGLKGGSTWAQLIEERIRPALAEGLLTEDALVGFLRDVEEYGRQHVFLFQGKGNGNAVPTSRAVAGWLDERGITDLLQSSTIVNMPKRPTVSEVRRERRSGVDMLTVKVIETRAFDTFITQRELDGHRYSREYQRAEARSVNVVRFHSDGLIEFRVQSHKNGSGKYEEELSKLQTMVMPLFNPTRSSPIRLAKAKATIYENRQNLTSVISFAGTDIRNTAGHQFTAHCTSQQNLFSHPATDKSLALLTADGEGYHEGLNLWWLAQAKERPQERMHVRLGGASNEFVVTQLCSPGDYEYVLAEIRKFNR
jgi:hypothetical protein